MQGVDLLSFDNFTSNSHLESSALFYFSFIVEINIEINCIYFCNQLSVGYVTKTEDMMASVRFTGVPTQGKMNTLFIFHRNVFMLNFIDHAVD